MKNQWKRVSSLFMTLAMTVTSVLTGVPTNVQAAEQNDKNTQTEVSDVDSEASTGSSDDFVYVDDGKFKVNGSDFYFAGANNYYINFKPDGTVDALFEDAEEMGLSVIRTWAMLDVGMATGEKDNLGADKFTDNVSGGTKETIWYQCFDPTTEKPRVNETIFKMGREERRFRR